mmetsp:Transcript_37937/g.81052  ORF Transcript_37937/g.81052 Transcript_37937/m.81052 type:complete len:254 (-) Transcript_37937:514-1275(-)
MSACSPTHSQVFRTSPSKFLEHFMTFTEAFATLISFSVYCSSSIMASSAPSPPPSSLPRGPNAITSSNSSILSLQSRTHVINSRRMAARFPLGKDRVRLSQADHTAPVLCAATLFPSFAFPRATPSSNDRTSDTTDAMTAREDCFTYRLSDREEPHDREKNSSAPVPINSAPFRSSTARLPPSLESIFPTSAYFVDVAWMYSAPSSSNLWADVTGRGSILQWDSGRAGGVSADRAGDGSGVAAVDDGDGTSPS